MPSTKIGTSGTRAAIVFSITLLLSSTLLFLIEPMFAKLVLPRLGGTAAVWNTCMVFFQACLLAGYAYAHLLTRWIHRTSHQVIVHAIVLALPLAFLPIALPHGWTPPADANPIPSLLMLLASTIGLPFFAVSTTAPLVQRWFASSGHRDAEDPYFLYAASNAGSMAALLGYPAIVEPLLRLGTQTQLWTWGYVAFAVMTLVCGVRAAIPPRGAGVSPAALDSEGKRGRDARATAGGVNAPQRLRWVVLALIPSSYLLGVTTYITTDVAAVPLLWVLPLALYLLTFILAFARKPIVSHRAFIFALPTAVLAPVLFMLAGAALPVWATVGLHLLAFFVAAMVCHGELARTRPPAEHLTEFYLMMSIGGVLGGAFNALAAPLLFTRAIEYPLAIVAACLVCPPRQTQSRRAMDLVLPVVAGVVAWASLMLVARHGNSITLKLAVLAVPALICVRLAGRRMPFATAIAALLVVATFFPATRGHLLELHRSFFGVHRVVRTDPGFNELFHGTTLHGRQHVDSTGQPDQADVPLTYYHRGGPIGSVLTALPHKTRRNVGVIGLGVGSLAAYAQAGDRYTFYEIDPAVRHVADESGKFTYLASARSRDAHINIILGDARLTLVSAPAQSFDVVVLDAFSGDAIPLHLLTREALAMYLDKLAPDGVLAVHISNLYLNLEPVVANLAADAGCVSVCRSDLEMTEEKSRAGAAPSTWLLIARQSRTVESFAGWSIARRKSSARVWTDDFSNVLSILR